MSPSAALLFVAGEASGDQIASAAVRALAIPAIGVGGDAVERAGGRLLVHMRTLSTMGLADGFFRLQALWRTWEVLLASVDACPPRAALLVNFTEFNARLGAALRKRGVPVLWCVAPQVWAWRPKRLHTLHHSMDALAVLFPFELPLWRAAGIKTYLVGHPAAEQGLITKAGARYHLGIPDSTQTIALLPGSRSHEIHRLLPAMLNAASELRQQGNTLATLLLAPSLESSLVRWVYTLAQKHRVCVHPVDAIQGLSPLLPAFDAALVASGTATLEAALADAPPVIAYRLDPLTAWVAKRALQAKHIGLPNLLLGQRAYPELVQDDVQGSTLAQAARSILIESDKYKSYATKIRKGLQQNDGLTVGERIAQILRAWVA